MATRRLSGIATSSSVPDNGGDHSGGSGNSVDDVFSTYLYTGQRSAGGFNEPQTIVNGIDLDGKGGLVWFKGRTEATTGAPSVPTHWLFDTERGVVKSLSTDEDAAQKNPSESLTSFNSDGFDIGTSSATSASTVDFASWTFAKQEGFFDVVKYMGDAVAGREIPHNLGSTPGMVIVKSTSHRASWFVYHKGVGPTEVLTLDTSDPAVTNATMWDGTAPTDTHFTVGSTGFVNGSGVDYVAYVFADDAPLFGPDGDESIIKCGGFTRTGVVTDVDLGWEPQFVLWKTTSVANDWYITDVQRGFTSASNAVTLRPNQPAVENASAGIKISSTGFTFTAGSGDYIYMAIRRPMKPAEEFEPDELFATDNAGPADPYQFHSGFPVDMAWRKYSGTGSNYLSARLMQGKTLVTDDNIVAASDSDSEFDFMEGWFTGGKGTGTHSWMFRRAPGFFDVVTYTGNSVAGREVPHNLKAAPEMMWVKKVDYVDQWSVYTEPVGNDYKMNLNVDSKAFPDGRWNYTDPNEYTFTVGGSSGVNGNDQQFIAFLWASVPGICDIGSYTGNGATQEIDCGFTNGARFILVKRTNDSGNWMYWDTLRGQNSTLCLNIEDSQKSGNVWSPYAQGFQVNDYSGNGSLFNPNNLNSEYIYMAIA